jgi:hypothetical protein
MLLSGADGKTSSTATLFVFGIGMLIVAGLYYRYSSTLFGPLETRMSPGYRRFKRVAGALTLTFFGVISLIAAVAHLL